MNKTRRMIGLALLALLLVSQTSWAVNAAPSLINYQARLTNAGGTPLNGTHSLTFRIYDVASGGTAIWSETHSSVTVTDGFLSVLLGGAPSPNPIDETVFASDTRYLGVTINADPEITPRSRMVSVGYSHRVQTVDKAKGGVISGMLQLEDDPSKDGDLVSAAIRVKGASLRVVRIEPSADVALSATSNDGQEVLNLSAAETGGAVTVKGSSNNPVASMAAVAEGGSIAVNAVNGDVAAQLTVATEGGQVTLSDFAKEGMLSSPRTKILPRQWIQFGSTTAESAVVVRRMASGAGVIEVADYTTPTPATVSIGNGTALKMKNSVGQTVVDVAENSARLSGNFTVSWPAAKAPGQGLVNYGTGNTFNFGLGGGDPAHAENAIVLGENNTIESKNVLVAGDNNLIDDDNDLGLNGDNSAIIGLNNTVKGDNSFTFGERNYIGANRSAAFGFRNYLDGGGNNFAFGDSNLVHATGNSAILAGNFNDLGFSENALICGGFTQKIDSSGYSVISGGYGCRIHGDDMLNDRMNAVAGGENNWIMAARGSSISGGSQNWIEGDYSIAAGGRLNLVNGDYSLAGGRRAKINAAHDGTFLWADQTDADFNSTDTNQFRVRATGGVQFVSGVGPEVGVELLSGAGAWSTLSDRNVKRNISDVDVDAMLERLAAMPIATWNYVSQDPSVRHIGPMAQDFYAAFGMGEKETHISTIDADGVALAAIQALYKRTQQLQRQAGEIEALKTQLEEVRTLLAKLAADKK